MSKQCTKCGHYNTELRVLGTSGYVLCQTSRLTLAAGAAVIAGLFNPSYSHLAAHKMMDDTKEWASDIKLYYCNHCKRCF